jgi:hypothetical protein
VVPSSIKTAWVNVAAVFGVVVFEEMVFESVIVEAATNGDIKSITAITRIAIFFILFPFYFSNKYMMT